MKKRILSVLLCLCMALVLLPTTALAADPQPLENVIFDYAYDVQRDPPFPTEAGKPITLSKLTLPVVPDEIESANAGEWTLTRVGTYSYVKTTGVTISFVDTVADIYDVTADEIVIHELKNGIAHIAYGVVIAYDSANEYAVFFGNNLSGSGAGYLLSNDQQKTETVTVTAGMIATDFVKNCSISLEPADSHTFPEAIVGYDDQTALDVTVTNTGNAATGDLTISLSGDNPDAFVVDPSAIESIAPNGNADGNGNGNNSFTVTPKTGLTAGTYTATVKVSGTDIVTQSFDVEFTVKAAAPVVRPRPNTPSGSTTVTVDSPKTADNSGLFLWTVLLFASGAGVLGTVYSSRKRRAE